MKKLFLSVLCLSAVLALSSCTRTYNCRCDGGAFGAGINEDIEAKTRNDAEEKCKDMNSSGAFGYRNCRLK